MSTTATRSSEEDFVRRGDVLKAVLDRVAEIGGPGWAWRMTDLKKTISGVAASDARPVVRGHYIGEYDGFADGAPVYDIWTCSACGHQFDECDEEPTYDFCPYCGADMRHKEESNA